LYSKTTETRRTEFFERVRVFTTENLEFFERARVFAVETEDTERLFSPSSSSPCPMCLRGEIGRGGMLYEEALTEQIIGAAIEAQLMTYMKLTGCKVGLLINFNEVLLKDGIRRRVL
jgi:hypothetical protein